MMRNLLRQHAAQFVKSVPPALEQADLLEAEHLQPLAAGHAGLPEATDSLAYDPVQHLLAVQIARSCPSDQLCCDTASRLRPSAFHMTSHARATSVTAWCTAGDVGCCAITWRFDRRTCHMIYSLTQLRLRHSWAPATAVSRWWAAKAWKPASCRRHPPAPSTCSFCRATARYCASTW